MLSTLWHSATSSSSARQDVTTSGPSSNSSSGQLPAAPTSALPATPFTDFVLSRLPDEESQKLFALSFGEHLRRDSDALEIDFDDVYKWLGMDLKASALRLLKRVIAEGEMLINRSVENPGSAGGRPRDVYMISFNQFEELMIAAQTSEGKKARKLVLKLKKILQEYIVAEHEAARASEAARANALQQQLDGLRAQQQHLYVFRLFGNRFKIGIAKDVDRRIRQHTTSCPSGHLVYSVPIACKAMEKLLESIMRTHGAWTKMEEYELTLSDEQIKAVFDVLTRVEELLNVTPLEDYHTLLALLDHRLRRQSPLHHLHTANKMKELLVPYFGRGIENRKSSCSLYTFDFDTLRHTMGCSLGD
ncbi:hypothetical protein COCOBI_07-0400 [Coccomyxa sp. Obi]|nr:hypothetical protein COCOBI_07-0400 [Coccomyxa sp. Obi]